MKIINGFDEKQVLFNNKFDTLNNKSGQDITLNKENNISFGETLKGCIDEINTKQVQADSYTNAFVKGDDVNIDEVMIKGEEASLALQFLVKTRDNLVESYKELIKMQL
ncbi:flagellar hook-basal body complex protein FliE [Clostridium botulinum]|uniref:Flagellar hook-basal body complex protein FliE n=1 Tax=Clostridium botulinum TaxID=1491 RepID=A0A0M1LCI7_CLOBO|nr:MULTISPECIES: flagellar hook-basal body complex protein FliE [Clostridium]EES51366.1 flagellar hook-basal body complex protein FliE [Clostridium botulinum E1 str. 'BoNT E Beluga']KAI3345920.1 flagellar hook-basal body complex protein FliE [Clostridium botulinum]KOM88517.1 flagellar hook-basal body protein FliE [Clostridium botulinum]KOR55175.1 flagellar hook-basal body protein FliE [Clostridium botulinum]MBN1034648.1 flagellar hook-basal body complex protein FliE [Clostridium botulinum]